MTFLWRNSCTGTPGAIVTVPADAAAGERMFDAVYNSYYRQNVPGGDEEGTTYPSTYPLALYYSDAQASSGPTSIRVAAGDTNGYVAYALPANETCGVFEESLYLTRPRYRDDTNLTPIIPLVVSCGLLTPDGQLAYQGYPVASLFLNPPDRGTEGADTQEWSLLTVDGQQYAAGGQMGLPYDTWVRVSLRIQTAPVVEIGITISRVGGADIASYDVQNVGPRFGDMTGGYKVGPLYAVQYGNTNPNTYDHQPYRFFLDDIVARSCDQAPPPAVTPPVDYDNAGVPNIDVEHEQVGDADGDKTIPCPPRYLVQRSSSAPTRLERLGRAELYRCTVMDRGGRALLWDIPAAAVAAVSWERRANDVGEHSVTISKRPGLLRALGRVRSWAQEAAIWRVPERGQVQLCAVGPITGRLEDSNTVKLTIRDLSAWWGKRVIHHDYSFTGCTDLTTIARFLINDGMAPDDPNFLQHALWLPSGVSVTRSGAAFRLMLDKEISDLTGLGLDWTMTGRRLVVGGELARLWPRVAHLNRSHFLADVEVEEAGGEALTRTFITGSGTTLGYAGGVDSDIGLLESTASNDAVTDAETARIASRAALAVAYPTPLYVRVPDGATLSPDCPIPLERLLPGVAVYVDIDGYALPVGQTQRLTRVAGSWDREAGEKIAVALAPYAGVPADDGSPVGPVERDEDVEREPDETLYDPTGESSVALASLPADGDDEPEGADDTALEPGAEEGDTGTDDENATQGSDGPDTPAPDDATDGGGGL